MIHDYIDFDLRDPKLLFVRQGQASVFGKQPYPYHWVAAQDIAHMVTSAYRLEEAKNKRFLVLGPEAIRMHEALKRYRKSLWDDHPSPPVS